MRKVDDKNARISSAHFCLEIDEDEEEEENDEKISNLSSSDAKEAKKHEPANQHLQKVKSNPEFVNLVSRSLSKKELELSVNLTKGRSLTIEGDGKTTLQEASRVVEQVSTVNVNASVNLLKNVEKNPRDDADRSRGQTSSKISCKTMEEDPVIIKLPMLKMNTGENLTPYTDKHLEKLSISKFIFPSVDRTGTLGGVAKRFLEVPQRLDENRRVFDVTSALDGSASKHTKMNYPISKGSASSPDFLTNSEIPKINGNSEDSPQTQESCRSGIIQLPIKNASSSRRPSITNAAIGSSIATSLVGASGGMTRSFMATDITSVELLARSGTPSSVSIASTTPSDDAGLEDVSSRFPGREGRRKSRLPFLRLHMPQPHSWSNVITASDAEDPDQAHHHHHHRQHHHHSLGTHFPHIHVPSFTFTGVGSEGTARKFNFGIRRHSQMVSP